MCVVWNITWKIYGVCELTIALTLINFWQIKANLQQQVQVQVQQVLLLFSFFQWVSFQSFDIY